MKKYTAILIFISASILYLFLLGNTSGGPAQTSGAPGEATCGRSGCHAVAENTGSAKIDLSFNEGNLTYSLGNTYPLNIELSDLQMADKNGFQIVALDSLDQNVGTWLLTDDKTTQIIMGTSLADRSYITHTRDGVSQTNWAINWQSPSELVGAITFYLAVNDANANGGRTGDDIYITNLTIAPAQSTSIQDHLSRQIVVSPNPTSDLMVIDAGTLVVNSLAIYSATGQRMLQRENATEIDLSSFQSGLYYLMLETEKGMVHQKIIKK